MDQIDHFLSSLRKKFGYFTVIQNPSTGVSWPAETFIKLAVPVLWKEEREGQLELFFEDVKMFQLSFRDDTKEFFVASAEKEGVYLDIDCPRPEVNLDGANM
jgi:hypothetical protein